ncbi:hypothetical protein ACDA63_18695 [Uliginosibacterium sp. sgz301328]|uniref:N-acyl amino acid synthase FeeM domain-containing protein n=1 Tax=Uliginosibacterium sp. sgz301328 TaxID=3243764 RepID=UPI00359D6F07
MSRTILTSVSDFNPGLRSRFAPASHLPPHHRLADKPGLLEPFLSLGDESKHGHGDHTFRVGIAHTAWQLDKARQLVDRCYHQAGFRPGTGATAHTARKTVTALAMRSSAPIATVSLMLDGPLGLNADDQYADELADLRAGGARLAEFGRLAFDSAIPFVRVLGPLVHKAARIGRHELGMTDIMVECHPRHADFYCRTLGFRRMGGLTHCRRVGAPAVLLHLHAGHLEQLAQDRARTGRLTALRSTIAMVEPAVPVSQAAHA